MMACRSQLHVVTARALNDGTNGVTVNSRTRIPGLRETAHTSGPEARAEEDEKKTFTLTADVTEAQQQLPIVGRV